MRSPLHFVSALLLSFALAACTSASSDDAAPSSADLTSTDLPSRAHGAPGCEGEGCVQPNGASSVTTTAAPAPPPPPAPTPTDGVKNGKETDVDCGGPDAPKCAAGHACLAASDCTTDACSVTGRCQVTRSCNDAIGAGDHCGPNMNDSCCASARVPAAGDSASYSVAAWQLDAKVSAFKLDTYEITVGRMRAFFAAMGGNPQESFPKAFPDGAGAHPHVPASGWRSAWNKRLPASWADIASRYGDPADAAGGSQYCMRGQGGEYGTTTYRKTPDANGKLVDNFDVKPMVCLDWYTLFAFCAWDGGRLPTSSEWGLAAGDDQGNKYSWGSSAPDASKVVTALAGFVPYPDFTWGLPYRTSGDRGTHIAPAGQKAGGQFGHRDLSGSVGEWLLDAKVPHGTCEDCADISLWSDPTRAWPDYEATVGAGSPTWKDGGYRVVRGGTWEGHDIRNIEGTWDGVEVGFTYHALGGRCARDL